MTVTSRKNSLKLKSNINFADQLILEPPLMNLDDILYVEVNLERPLVSDAFAASTDFAVVLEHCWGTPHNNRNGDLKERIFNFLQIFVCVHFLKHCR